MQPSRLVISANWTLFPVKPNITAELVDKASVTIALVNSEQSLREVGTILSEFVTLVPKELICSLYMSNCLFMLVFMRMCYYVHTCCSVCMCVRACMRACVFEVC